MTDSFVFYRSFWEGLKNLPDETVSRLVRAVCEYALDGTMPNLAGLEQAVFASWKANIDASQKKRNDGRKGGRPKKTSGYEEENQWLLEHKPVVTDEKPMVTEEKPMVSDSKPNGNGNGNGNGNVNVNDKERERFKPPTLDEVKAYCAERKSPVDPVRFFEFFEAGGWKDSKGQKVRNWKQKLITWERHSPEKKQNAFMQIDQHEYDFDALEKELLSN